MVATHCLPSEARGATELPVAPINPAMTVVTAPGAGPYRGIVVTAHGLITNRGYLPPQGPQDLTFFGLQVRDATFAADLNADGWIMLNVLTNGDNWSTTGNVCHGISRDINHDDGTRYHQGVRHWWEHIRRYIRRTWGDWPVIAYGGSWGGMHALTTAETPDPPTAILAYCPATIQSALPAGLWAGEPLPGDTSGADIPTTALNTFTGPSLVAYGTSDPLTGWSASSTPPSNADAIITNAQAAGRPCTRLATHYTLHGFDLTDEASFMAWVTSSVDPLAPKVL